MIYVIEVRRKDFGELLGSRSIFNVDNWGKGNRIDAKGSNKDRSKSKNKGKSKSYPRQAMCWNCQKPGTLRRIAKIQRKNGMIL